MRRSKKSCQYLHAKARCLERYKLAITKSNYKQMVAMIQNQDGVFVRSQSNRVSVWIITFKGIRMKAIYDCKRHSIATFLDLTERDYKLLGVDPPNKQNKPVSAEPNNSPANNPDLAIVS